MQDNNDVDKQSPQEENKENSQPKEDSQPKEQTGNKEGESKPEENKGTIFDCGREFKELLFEFTAMFLVALVAHLANLKLNDYLLAYWVIIVVFFRFSGSHVNAAVTLGNYVAKLEFGKGLFKLITYWIFQILGSILGIKLAQLMAPGRSPQYTIPPTGPIEMLWGEFFFTGSYVFVYLMATGKHTKPSTAPTVQMAVVAGWLGMLVACAPKICFGAFNPTLLWSMNHAAYKTDPSETMNYVYKGGAMHLLGAIAFAIIYRFIFVDFHLGNNLLESIQGKPAEEKSNPPVVENNAQPDPEKPSS